MKIVIAPDSFKGSMTAREASEAIKQGILRVNPHIDTVLFPMADGGEGTVESLVSATGGTIIHTTATDPLGREIEAFYGILGDGETCVIETAAASGLTLLSDEECNPLKATSYGTGELIHHALDHGYRRFIIGLGGSATNDGGAGILQALGVRLLDRHGQNIPPGGGYLHQLARIDSDGMHPGVKQAEFVIASDVDNPLVGDKGASRVYGPQKGATPEMVEKLDQNLANLADRIEEVTGISVHTLPGGGAAGGIGAVCHTFFQGKMEKGSDLVIRAGRLQEKLAGASLVITGEGKMDEQTARGKAPYGILKVAQNHGVPVVALAGSLGEGADRLVQHGFAGVISIIDRPMTLAQAVDRGKSLLTYTAEQVVRIFVSTRKRRV
ncbi:MAG: glycerate kinase [Bacillaceae bacterium]|nr:glycerate kinase [Bacillaceae bacterium]